MNVGFFFVMQGNLLTYQMFASVHENILIEWFLITYVTINNYTFTVSSLTFMMISL